MHYRAKKTPVFVQAYETVMMKKRDAPTQRYQPTLKRNGKIVICLNQENHVNSRKFTEIQGENHEMKRTELGGSLGWVGGFLLLSKEPSGCM